MNYILAALVVICSLQAQATDWEESPDLAGLFAAAGVQGTFVVYDVAADTYIGHDRSRAEHRFVPASTFKIANSLIGLAVSAVQDVDEILPYGGQPQPIKAWERDMGLREAIAMSNVAIYQTLARRIGLERMRENVAGIGFGNGEIGTTVDDFWLRGPLQISAVEQTRFLARLARDALPFPPAIQASVREIILLDRGADWSLYGKTGWATASNPGVGWWVGWVHKANRLYPFALNMDMRQISEAGKRIELGKACLKTLGIL